MPLINITYPVTGTEGFYKNVFPSQKPLIFSVRRLDQSIQSITSGTNGVVKIKTPSVIEDIEIGDFVSWGTDAYSNRSSRVLNVLQNGVELEVDEVFVSTNSANSFINYKKNWYLEIQYVDKSTAFNDQNAIKLFDFNTQVPNALDGTVSANIGLPAEKLTPDFNIESGINEGLFTEYKIQFRESWTFNRNESWRSTEPNKPIMLVHGTDNIPDNNYTDIEGTKRFVLGYPLIYTYVYSDINDAGGNTIKFFATQHDIKQDIIISIEILEVVNANGVYILFVDTNTIDADCVYIRFTTIKSSSGGQYSGEDYDETQYQVSGIVDGFPFTFPHDLT